MRQSVIILAMAALVSGCAGGGGGRSATPALTAQSGVLQPQSAAREQTGKHREAECDDRDGRKRDSRDSRRRADHDDRDDRDGGDRDRHECTPSPTPTPAPTARPPGPLTVTCDAYAVAGTPANCAMSNPSFTGPVAMAYSGSSACTGPASVIVPPAASAQFQVNASGGGGCHVAAAAGSQQAAADITFTR